MIQKNTTMDPTEQHRMGCLIVENCWTEPCSLAEPLDFSTHLLPGVFGVACDTQQGDRRWKGAAVGGCVSLALGKGCLQ
jgi:hypothetical protein